MPIEKLKSEENYPYLDERIRALARAVPEAMADGKINWEKLREALRDAVEEEEASAEHFGLSWPGKRAARALAAQPPRGALRPAPGEGVNEETTENLYIEGENLAVMKLLLKSYAGKVKMIYIDPPYNTGNDFIYNDKFAESLEAYLAYTGATGEGGEILTTNTRADGRFHSKWLNMMYPRLLLAHQLLRDDGVILISIDDNEFHNLRQQMNEIFGEENFISSIIRKTIEGGKQDSNTIQKNHEYLLIYSKNREKIILNRKSQENFDHYSRKDKHFNTRGYYYLKPLENRGLGYVESLDYPIEAPNGEIVFPGGDPENNGYRWVWSKEKFEEGLSLDLIEFVNGQDGKQKVYYKTYQFMNSKGEKIIRSVPFESLFLEGYTNRQSGNELRNLFDGKRVFTYAKPTSFIKELILLGTNNEDYVLDFFSGSGTTGHALYKVNFEQNSNRKFILVQLPEKVEIESEEYKIGFHTIFDVGKERIRRVIAQIEADATIPAETKAEQDLGFKVFKYGRSNLTGWDAPEGADVDALEPLFASAVDALIPDWQPQNLLSEILLLEGFPLTSRVEHLEEAYASNTVYRVSAPDFCPHALVVCLDDEVADTTVELLAMDEGDVLICRDSALHDEQKARLADRFTVHVI